MEGPEAHHLAMVCRVRPGDVVCLFNGDGRQYPAQVVAVARKHVVLDVRGVETPARELGFRLEVAAPLPRGDRAQFLLEKLTELGATAFTPLQTSHSVVRPRDTKLEKLERHVIEASKQCGRNVLLQVRTLLAWSDFLQSDLPPRRLLAHPRTETPWREAVSKEDVVVAVGPEGGFTEDEVAEAHGGGWALVDLGPRILRVETAAIYLTALLAQQQEKD